MREDSRSVEPSPGYQLFMLVLSLFALGQLSVQAAFRLEPSTRAILKYADLAVCVIFFVDFLITLARSPDRFRYMRTWGWIDLLSSIPTMDIARWGRFARVLQIFRILRALRAARTLSLLILKNRGENTFLAVSLFALLTLVSCSIAVLYFETAPSSNIKTAEDAAWWAVTTMTTVGYGDRVPVTTEGRAVAILLMAAGVGLFGTLSGILAAWLLGPSRTAEAEKLENLAREIAALRAAIETGPRSPAKDEGTKGDV